MHSEAEVLTKIRNLLTEKPKGMTTEDIAKSLPLNRTSTAKYLNTLLISGQIEQQVVGRAKLFKCSNRVPMSRLLSFYSEAIIVMDHERLIREINPQFFEYFGIPKEEVIGKKFDTLLSETDITHVLMPGICQAVDGQIISKDQNIQKGNERLYFRSKYLPVVFDEGPPGAAVILEDITETQKIQQKYENFLKERTTDTESINAQVLSDVIPHIPGNTALATSRIPGNYLMDYLPDLIVEIDADMKPRYVSPSHHNVLGYDPEELMAGDMMDLFHPDDREKMSTVMQEAVKNQKPTRQDHRLRHKDGHYIWFESVGNPLYDAKGRYNGGIISSRDVSDRVCQTEAIQQNCIALQGNVDNLLAKEQEIQSNIIELSQQRDILHKNEQMFHAIFDSAYDAIFLIRVNPDGTPGEYIDINEAACRLLGYSRKELLGMSAGDILSRTPQSTILSVIARRINKPSRGWFDAAYTRDDGKVMPVEASVRIIPSGSDKIAMVAVREIKEREEAEEALQESERKIRALFDQTFQFIGMMTLDGTLIEANRTAMQFAGINESDCLGKPFWDTPWWAHSEKLQKRLRDAVTRVAKGETVRFEATHSATDGSIHFIDFSLKPIKDENGKVIFLIPEGRDITERKLAEEALRVAQEKYTKAFLSCPDAIMLSDLETGRFVEINDATTQIYGYSRDEMIGKSALELGIWLKKEERETFTNLVKTQGRVMRYELVERRKSGDLFSALVSADTITLGNKTHLLSTVRDISERKKVEAALRASDERLRTIADTIPGVLFQFYARSSGEMGLYFVSGRSEELFGISGDAASFFPKFTECVAPEDRQAFLMSIDLAVKTCKTWDFRGRYIKPSGEVICFHGSSEPMQSGDELVFHGVVLDITAQARAERARLASDERLRSTLASMDDLVFNLDENDMFIDSYTSVAANYFAPPEQFLGKSVKDVLPTGPTGMILKAIDSVRNTGATHQVEYSLPMSGKTAWYNAKISPRHNQKGAFAGVTVVARDITERKNYEEELRQTNQQLSLLTDITRCDILDKVTAIMGQISHARKKYSDPEIAAVFETIDMNTREIKSQIEFTKMYQTLGTLEPEWLDLDYLISLLQVPPHITLQSSIQGIGIYADPLFRQVFSNLLEDAQIHGEHVTTITVSEQRTRLGLTLIWEDNGVGVPADQKKKIFKRGFGKNTGLGLFLIQEILSITGIKIRETGIEGQGARFEIIVPKGAFKKCQHPSVTEKSAA